MNQIFRLTMPPLRSVIAIAIASVLGVVAPASAGADQGLVSSNASSYAAHHPDLIQGPLFLGPIESVTPDGSAIQVLGSPIPVFGEHFLPSQYVAVFGSISSTGALEIASILVLDDVYSPGSSPVLYSGWISNHPVGAGAMEIGSAKVRTTELPNFDGWVASLSNGAFVVMGTQAISGAAIDAHMIISVSGNSEVQFAGTGIRGIDGSGIKTLGNLSVPNGEIKAIGTHGPLGLAELAGRGIDGSGAQTQGRGIDGSGAQTQGRGIDGSGAQTQGRGIDGSGAQTQGRGIDGSGAQTQGRGIDGSGAQTQGRGIDGSGAQTQGRGIDGSGAQTQGRGIDGSGAQTQGRGIDGSGAQTQGRGIDGSGAQTQGRGIDGSGAQTQGRGIDGSGAQTQGRGIDGSGAQTQGRGIDGSGAQTQGRGIDGSGAQTQGRGIDGSGAQTQGRGIDGSGAQTQGRGIDGSGVESEESELDGSGD
jgi:hypothetical protein